MHLSIALLKIILVFALVGAVATGIAVATLGVRVLPWLGRDQPWQVDYSEIRKVKLIGRGKFGKVYKSIWREKEVAVKVLNNKKSGSIDSSILSEFAQEVRIMCDLRHPNVLMFIGACTRMPHLCIITAFM